MLAINLPPGAMTWQEMGTDTAWTVGEHLLADAVDALRGANWQRGGGNGQQPEPVPRPAALRDLKDKRLTALDKAARFKARQAAKK